MKRIRIAYLIDTVSCDTAGTQKQLLETITRLDKETFQPLLVCLRQSPWMQDNALPCECIVLEYQGFLKCSFPRVVWQLRRVLREWEIDILQTFFVDSIFVAFFAWLFATQRPALISSRRDIGLGDKNQPVYHKLFRLLLPFVNRFFNGILANSDEVREFVARNEKVPFAKVKVIKNGIDLPAPEAPPHVLAISDNAVWVGIAASLTPVKRHDVLVQAAALVNNRNLDKKIHYLLLGDGPERASLRQMCRLLGIEGQVHFAGAVKNVTAYLQHLDICVLCSDREGLSNAILEYMACGKPVIATAVGGNAELVSAGNGIVVPPADPQALADGIAELIMDENRRKILGAGSLSKIKNTYSWDKTMDETQNYYRSLLGGV